MSLIADSPSKVFPFLSEPFYESLLVQWRRLYFSFWWLGSFIYRRDSLNDGGADGVAEINSLLPRLTSHSFTSEHANVQYQDGEDSVERNPGPKEKAALLRIHHLRKHSEQAPADRSSTSPMMFGNWANRQVLCVWNRDGRGTESLRVDEGVVTSLSGVDESIKTNVPSASTSERKNRRNASNSLVSNCKKAIGNRAFRQD